MNKSLFHVVIVAALGGFLFGFDSGVISGCEKAIQTEFGLSAFWHGLIVSGALIGTVIGVFTAGTPSDKWGRKPTLWLMGVLFLISAVGCALTPFSTTWGPHLLGWFRFIGGLAVGGVSVVVPLYIVEVSPSRYRGRLVAANQLNIVLGILVSYILVRKKGKVASIIDTLIMFPYVIPGSVLGIGLIVAFNRKPLILVGTSAIMIISYVVRKLPYTVRSGSAFLYQMDPSVEEASINLGVSPMKTFFTVTARMMLPGIMSGAVLSWITCINELSSSIMLYSGKTSTIAVAIYQEVTRMSDGTAGALATILTVTTIISLLIVFRLTKGKVKIV